jgi:hypothetical protein
MDSLCQLAGFWDTTVLKKDGKGEPLNAIVRGVTEQVLSSSDEGVLLNSTQARFDAV